MYSRDPLWEVLIQKNAKSSCAPEIFQAKMSQLCQNLSGVKVSMDDIIVYAKKRAEHDKRLHKVLQ